MLIEADTWVVAIVIGIVAVSAIYYVLLKVKTGREGNK
jgi:hypothetical protein